MSKLDVYIAGDASGFGVAQSHVVQQHVDEHRARCDVAQHDVAQHRMHRDDAQLRNRCIGMHSS